MKHRGKLNAVILGEILHNVNNPLTAILMIASRMETPEADLIVRNAERISVYLKSLQGREEFTNDPFENEGE